MKASDCMTRGIEGIQSTDSLLNASIRMKTLDIGALAVFTENRLVGIITDRDIVVRGIATSRDPAHTAIAEVMSKNPKMCREDASIDEVAKIMENNKVRRILVENKKGEITGILTISDLAIRGETELFPELIKEVKQHFGPVR